MYWVAWVPRSVDDREQTKVECREDSTALVRNPAEVSQIDYLSTHFGDHSVVIHGWRRFNSIQLNFGSHFQWSANYDIPYLISHPTSFFQLCQLRTIRRSLTPEATCALVQAFVNCRLDNCNSLLVGDADVHLRRIRSLQNATASLVSGAGRHWPHHANSRDTSLASSSSATDL